MSDEVDIADLRRRTQAAREFRHQIGDVVFDLRHPTRYEHEHIWSGARGDNIAGLRALVEASVTGWSGVRVEHAFPESKTPGVELPFDAETLALVLDEQTGWLNVVGMAIIDRVRERYDKIGAAVKNSSSGSGGSATEPALPE